MFFKVVFVKTWLIESTQRKLLLKTWVIFYSYVITSMFLHINFTIKLVSCFVFQILNMALNKFMHERNPFKTQRPDFKALALKYDKFRQVASTDLRGSVTLDFKKPECLQALTWCLLKEHFELDVDLPLDRWGISF